MIWRELNAAEKLQLWAIAGELTPLHPKMQTVPVQLDPIHGNPNGPTHTTISRHVYGCAGRCHQRIFFDGTQSLPLKIENGVYMIQVNS